MTDNIDDTADASVAITLDGQTRYLEPTPNAIRAISRQFDGLMNAQHAIARGDFNALEFVIAAGLDQLEQKARRATGDLVYAAGMDDLSMAAVEYINILGFGGRRPPDELDGDEAGEDDAAGEAKGV